MPVSFTEHSQTAISRYFLDYFPTTLSVPKVDTEFGTLFVAFYFLKAVL